MDDSGFSPGVWSLVGAGLGAMISYGLVTYRLRLSGTLAKDKALLELRLKAYSEIWKALGVLANPATASAPPTTTTLSKLLAEMLDWYYGPGGILMSDHSMAMFQVLKKRLRVTTECHPPETKLADAEIDEIFEYGSHFRTCLCADIGSRQPLEIASDETRLLIESRTRELADRINR